MSLSSLIDHDLVGSLFERAASIQTGTLVPPESFHEFKMRVCGPGYKMSPHIDMIDRILEHAMKLVEQDRDNPKRMFCVSMPPRHSKTFNFCEMFPAHFLGRNPNRSVVTVSYAQRKANEASFNVRQIIESEAFQHMYNVQLSPRSSAVDRWRLDLPYSGGLVAAGIGGATGYGGSVIVCDDPHANLEEARSEVMRDKVWDSFTNDFLSRREGNPVIIVVQTRWHPDDVIGRIIKYIDPEEYDYLRLPALAEADDPMGRELGSPLWPEEFNRRELLSQRAAMGAMNFAGLYQQDPKIASGGIFDAEWLRHEAPMKRREYHRVIVAVDPAVTSNKDSDETGIIVVAVDKQQQCWVLADRSLRTSPRQWAQRVVDTYHEFDADNIVVEVNQGGDLVKTTIHSVDYRVPVTSVRATMGKLLRFEPVASLYEQRRVIHAAHFHELEMQMEQWAPGDTESPDRLDACCYGITNLMLVGGLNAMVGGAEGLWDVDDSEYMGPM